MSKLTYGFVLSTLLTLFGCAHQVEAPTELNETIKTSVEKDASVAALSDKPVEAPPRKKPCAKGDHCPYKRKSCNKDLLAKYIDLTEEQAEKIKEIRRKSPCQKSCKYKKRKFIQSILSLDPNASDYDAQVERIAEQQADKMREKVMEHAKVYEVLTPEQRATLKEKLQSSGHKGKGYCDRTKTKGYQK